MESLLPLGVELSYGLDYAKHCWRNEFVWDSWVKQSHFLVLLTGFACSLPTSFAWADETDQVNPSSEASATQTYGPNYFTHFAPQTAADMVARLPGFEIRGGEGGARGFGQASLNILINGRRPSSKSSGANDILRRIPAANVTQIEIVDGATLDIPGLTGQVANIIAKTGELSGSWNWAARFEEGSRPQLADGGISFSAKRGRLEAVGGLNFGQYTFTEHGDETFFDGLGAIIQDREEKIGFVNQRPSASLNLSFNRDNGDIANLNLSGHIMTRDVTVQEVFENLTDESLSGTSVSENGTDSERFEISGDYSFDVPAMGTNGRLKLIALHRTDTTDLNNLFVYEDIGSGQTRYTYLLDDKATEYIARSEYTWKSGDTNDWSLAVEGAVNTLASEGEVIQDRESLQIEYVDIEEDRVQANLSRSWALNDRTNMQISTGAEYSVISGDVSSLVGPDYLPADTVDDEFSDSFFRPKGFANISFKLDEAWTFRAEVERSVGQLNFGTYVSGVNFASGTETSGGKIVPEQKWEGELELHHQNSSGLSGRAKVFYQNIQDPILQVLFDDDSQGPGNLDNHAHRYGIEGNLTWVLDDVLKGLWLSVDGILADSEIEDPITLQTRATNGQRLWEYDIEARWDIDGTPFAIEAEIEQGKRDASFRVDEWTSNTFIRPEFQASLIHKDLFGMQWTAKIQNILDFELRRERFIFDETLNGDLTQRELTRRQRGQRFSIEVTDTF